MEIRQAKPTDLDALIDVINRAYEIYKIELPDLPDVSFGVEEEIAKGNVWVVDQNGVMGGVFLAFAAKGAVLTNIAVDPLLAGQGFGKALIRRAENECRKRNISKLKLATHAKMPENIALYTHLGWMETRREGNKVFMRKTL